MKRLTAYDFRLPTAIQALAECKIEGRRLRTWAPSKGQTHMVTCLAFRANISYKKVKGLGFVSR